MNENDIQLHNIDPDDIDDVICKIQNSFGIKFAGDDFKEVCNFGQLCDAVANKIDLQHADGCTTQQAFYKLRMAIQQVKGIDKAVLTPATSVGVIFPMKHRRKEVKKVENLIGFPLKILQPKQWVANCLLFSFIPAFILMFFNWIIGLCAFGFLMACSSTANYFARQLKVYTLGEIAEYIALENYRKVRRNHQTVNKTEVERIVKGLFMLDLSLPEKALEREAAFN